MSTNATPLEGKTTSLRERKKLQTRQSIHEAARDLVMERGFANITIADVCARAEISERTFFNYFPSKAAAALGLPPVAITEEYEQRFLASTNPLIDDLCKLVADTAGARGDVMSLKKLMAHEPDLLREVHQWATALREQVIGLAEQRTEPRRARLAVTLVYAALVLQADSSAPKRPSTPEDLRAAVAALVSVAND
ncbi:TetR/AcrR family transcriptional regulator [Sinomonas sp. ASV322]|uniref:TetR/AcrR family transcriptional regulator n=1 Tax=Sinomonas sp. ASV322 TaxID=3041920 RepID=UPI0027DD71B8|nr:TetR/AcrR family transcriptional regulator [Sinomonas sp. ASV322]MDQ4502505.1 TetR/AcrR family transcriptional regulator [Sinomonas sp. ASV322]